MRSYLMPIVAALATAVAGAINTATAQLKPASAFEIVASELRVRPAVTLLDRAASALFAEAGERYLSPRIVAFEGSITTKCGIVQAFNAYACRADGSIYYDKAFLAALMVGAANALHTNGDMAAIEPIAHEWGHMLQYLLQTDYTTARNRSEPDADCLSGVLLARMQRQQQLQSGDLEEARWAVAVVGDESLGDNVWGNVIEQLNLTAPPGSIPVITNARGNHGNSRERLQAFARGLAGTIASCTAGIPRPGRVVVTEIHWFVNDMASAYDRGVAVNKPIVFVSVNFNDPNFQRFKTEILESPAMTQLANYAIFAYSDPARDIVARNIGKALGYGRLPAISLLAPNPNLINEEQRMTGVFTASASVDDLTIHMKSRGWLGTTRAPWLPPRPSR